MFNLQELLEVAGGGGSADADWLRDASAGIYYLQRNAGTNEIIIFSNIAQMLSHSILVPVAGVSPPDGHKLQHSWFDVTSQWGIEHVSGGGEPDRMYLAPPVGGDDCSALDGAEKLVFRRHFDGVDNGAMRTELSQPMVQALGLYWLDEANAYCKLNENGDVEPVIRLFDLSKQIDQRSAMLVTINAEQLHRYMAVTETALMTRFDFTRCTSGSFLGWNDDHQRDEINEDDLFYHTGIQANGSYANGAMITRSVLSKQMLIDRANRRWNDDGKVYAIFKAHDWKNNRLAEISCAPTALASYFDKDSDLPFQVTPAFFRPEVLQKYKADLDKYQLEHRSINSRGGWYLKSYDVNEEGQVHAYLCDLAKLPHSEQLYWQSFNEWPKGPISSRAFQTDFEGTWSTIPDPLVDLKHEIAKLDKSKPYYWQPRGETIAAAVHYPVTDSTEEWSNAILALDQLIVEGFAIQPLRERLKTFNRQFEPQWQSLKLLKEVLLAGGVGDEETA